MKFYVEEDIRAIIAELGYRPYGLSLYAFKKTIDEHSHFHLTIAYNGKTVDLHIDTNQKMKHANRRRGIKHWTVHKHQSLNIEKQMILCRTFNGKLTQCFSSLCSRLHNALKSPAS